MHPSLAAGSSGGEVEAVGAAGDRAASRTSGAAAAGYCLLATSAHGDACGGGCAGVAGCPTMLIPSG